MSDSPGTREVEIALAVEANRLDHHIELVHEALAELRGLYPTGPVFVTREGALAGSWD